METYTLLRAFADSWFLIGMVVFFLGTWVYAFWPSLQSERDAAASIPLRDDTAGCGQGCEDCFCKLNVLKGSDNG